MFCLLPVMKGLSPVRDRKELPSRGRSRTSLLSFEVHGATLLLEMRRSDVHRRPFSPIEWLGRAPPPLGLGHAAPHAQI